MRCFFRAAFAAALAIVSLVSTARPSEAQGYVSNVEDVKQILMGNRMGFGPWFGGGVDGRAPSCAGENCYEAQAIRFNNQDPGGKIGVWLYGTAGYKPYLAYLNKGQRFPDDENQHFGGKQWVKFNSDGSFSWTNPIYTRAGAINASVRWDNCRIRNTAEKQKAFDCNWVNEGNGGHAAETFYLIMKGGPSPTTWPF